VKEGFNLKVVLLISANSELQGEIARLCPEKYHLVACNSHDHGRVILNDISQGLILLDTDQNGAAQWLQKAIITKPELLYIAVGKQQDKFTLVKDIVYDCLTVPCKQWQLEMLLDRAWERTELQFTAVRPEICSKERHPVGGIEQDRPWARVLSDFSRTLSNQFNIDKFLGLFLNAVKELVPVGKVSFLLKDSSDDYFVVAVQQGLDPDVYGKLRFSRERGLISWLSETGRILEKTEAAVLKESGQSGEYLQEMILLNAEVCLPLFANGRLCGVLCLGPKVTGARFHEKELELLYSVCGNIAYALNDLGMHERLFNQKVYIESILQLMNSGVIAIDNKHNIMTFNERAGEIISADPEQYTGRDLRVLPSPLGDILFETLLTGKAYHKKEYEISNDKKPLEISTYRMTDESGDVLGSVMIIDDITQRIKAQAEKNHAEQTEMLNRFVSQLTHEIKNPMVSIQTFSELLPEKYDDPDFREIFSKTVFHDLRRLNELVDQLIAFSSPLHYQYEIVNLHALLDDSIETLNSWANGVTINVQKQYCRDNLMVRADRANLVKALYYLLRYFSADTGNGKSLLLRTAYSEKDELTKSANILISDSVTIVKPEYLENLFNPLDYRPDNTISLGLPVSKKIIEDHEGRLHVIQPKGSFLKFGVSLPIFSASHN
jgi:PAS domain S-box-containing protein